MTGELNRIARLPRWLLVVFVVGGSLAGCNRAHYRRDADRETYNVIEEKADNALWTIPHTLIVPPRQSRLHDPFDPDCPPIPPDDPAAHKYMHCADCIEGYDGWHEHGDAPWIEDPTWRNYLPLSEDGTLLLSPTRAVEMGVLHSREYQSGLESLFLSALSLTLERFAFDVQWFGRNTTFFEHFGSSSTDKPATDKVEGNESNTLTTASNLGFTRNFATGGQLLVDFANAFVWEFTGSGDSSASSNIGVSLVQPLLRRAGREVRLEGLTQSERSVLYTARAFARFRKQFFISITVGGEGGNRDDEDDGDEIDDADVSYLSLLRKLQRISNFEANLKSLEQNLRLHQALAEGGFVSPIQVLQVDQRYQRGRFDLIEARVDFETDLDKFKLKLGLPPDLKVALDDSLLDPFQLSEPASADIEREIDQLVAKYRVLDEAPPLDELERGFATLKPFDERLAKVVDQVKVELARWQVDTSQPAPGDDAVQIQRERAARQQLSDRLTELATELTAVGEHVDEAAAGLREDRRGEAWEQLQKLARQELELVADLFGIQTQIRAYLIQLRPIDYELDSAVQFAKANRLDLMNRRAEVVDRWRKITVAADGLESDFDVFANANIATDPDRTNPVAFGAEASRYQVGFRIDGPLNRKFERNVYRAVLVNYQRARRDYMRLEDRVAQSVRRTMRELAAERLNFEIARQRLIVAARQVEEARLELNNPERGKEKAGDSSSTQDVLNALNDLLDAKNDLIGSWVDYESGRLELLLELEALQLDETGVYTNDHEHLRERPGRAETSPDPDNQNALITP
jgi:outer membrane protein TolC